MGDAKPVRLEVTFDRRTWDDCFQAGMTLLYDNDYGSGYRIAGAKYDGLGSTTLLRATLDRRDRDEIRRMLDAADEAGLP